MRVPRKQQMSGESTGREEAVIQAWLLPRIWLELHDRRMAYDKAREDPAHTWDLDWCFKAAFLGRPLGILCFLCFIPKSQHSGDWDIGLWLFINCRIRLLLFMWLKSLKVWIIKGSALRGHKHAVILAVHSEYPLILYGYWNYSHLLHRYNIDTFSLMYSTQLNWMLFKKITTDFVLLKKKKTPFYTVMK